MIGIVFRVPALAALLLFAHAIETTGDVSRIIFDAWLEVMFADSEQGQNQLITAIKLRYRTVCSACALIHIALSGHFFRFFSN